MKPTKYSSVLEYIKYFEKKNTEHICCIFLLLLAYYDKNTCLGVYLGLSFQMESS